MSEFAKQVSPVALESEMRESYLAYAMSVIVGRALPDVRDGLKPVHRRVLYAMNVLSNDYNKPYKKSARVVGDVIGKYHPHGDTAAYDTIVRMAQDFFRYAILLWMVRVILDLSMGMRRQRCATPRYAWLKFPMTFSPILIRKL